MISNQVLLDYEDILNTYKSREHGIKALSKYVHWFPIKASPELAGIIGDLMGDGHLQKEPKSRIDYTSNSVHELERFNAQIYAIFSIRGKIRDCTTNTYGTKNLGVNNKPLGRVLQQLRVPAGAKVFIPFSIPAWITKDKNAFAAFVRRLFTCEGNVDVYSKCIDFRMHKSVDLLEDGISFFADIKKHLEVHFDIHTTNPFPGGISTRKDGRITKGIRIKIKSKDSLIKFSKYVGFDDEKKQKRLDEIIESLLNKNKIQQIV